MSVPTVSANEHKRAYPPLAVALGVWSLGAALYLIGFFHRVAPAVMTAELSSEFALGAAALGNLSALYFYTYVSMQVPTGVLVDHYGPRRVLAAGAALAAAGTLLFALAPGYALVGLGRLVLGAGVGVAFVAMLKLASHWVAPQRFATVSGLALACGVLGGVCAGVPLRIGVDAFGWRTVMVGAALLTAAVAVAIWLHVRDDPAERGWRSHAPGARPGAPSHSMLGGIVEVLRYRNVWTGFIACGAITGPVLAFGGLWGVPYFVQHYGMSTREAAVMTSTLLVAWAVGGPLAGALSDRMRLRKLPIIAGGAVASLLWVLLVYGPVLPVPALLVLLAANGVVSGVVVIGFAFAKESAPPSLSGTAGGVANTGNMFGGLVMQPAIGWLLDRAWQGAMSGGSRVYDAQAWQGGLSLMIAWIIIGTALMLLARETHCRQLGS